MLRSLVFWKTKSCNTVLHSPTYPMRTAQCSLFLWSASFVASTGDPFLTTLHLCAAHGHFTPGRVQIGVGRPLFFSASFQRRRVHQDTHMKKHTVYKMSQGYIKICEKYGKVHQDTYKNMHAHIWVHIPTRGFAHRNKKQKGGGFARIPTRT